MGPEHRTKSRTEDVSRVPPHELTEAAVDPKTGKAELRLKRWSHDRPVLRNREPLRAVEIRHGRREDRHGIRCRDARLIQVIAQASTPKLPVAAPAACALLNMAEYNESSVFPVGAEAITAGVAGVVVTAVTGVLAVEAEGVEDVAVSDPKK